MSSTATYVPGQGVVLTIRGATEGLSVTIPDSMTIQAMQNHVRELQDWLEADV
jgi:hypothetical protein